MSAIENQAVLDLRKAVDAVCALEVRAMSGQEAAGVAHALAELQDRQDGVRLDALAYVQDSGVWALDGSRSAAAWLAQTERRTKAAAGADLKTARLLTEHLTATSAAVREGGVPVGHARILTRICLRTEAMRDLLADPYRGEAFLLAHAGLGAEDFQRFATAWAYRADPDAADQLYQEGREGVFLDLATTTDGVAVRGFLDPVSGEALRTALRAEIGIPSAADVRTIGQRQHDALASIVQRVLGGGSLGRHASVRPQVVVHVPLATVEARASAAGIPPAVLQESKSPIPRFVLDRIMCDSDITRIVFGPRGEVLDVGRSQRTFTNALRRALDAHDGGCMWPGCEVPPEQCQGHHTDPRGWAGGATTEATEGGILACGYHHDRIHALGITITRDARGNWEFHDRHGQLIGRSRPRSLEPDLWDPWEATA